MKQLDTSNLFNYGLVHTWNFDKEHLNLTNLSKTFNNLILLVVKYVGVDLIVNNGVKSAEFMVGIYILGNLKKSSC